MWKSLPALTAAIPGLLLLAACSPSSTTYKLWLIATPTSVSSPTPSAIRATVTSSGAAFAGTVTFAVSGCGTIAPASATAVDGVATATFTPSAAAVTENCIATITSEAANDWKWPFKTLYATGTGTVTVLPPPVTSAPVPVSANPAGSAPTTMVVRPSVTPQTWIYDVSLNPASGGNDRIVMMKITLNVACSIPGSTGFSPTITPASGSSATWQLQYPGSGVTTDTITFAKCDGKPGGTAQFDARVNSAENVVPAVSATGPK